MDAEDALSGVAHVQSVPRQLANEGVDFEALPAPPNPYDGVVTMVIESSRMDDLGYTSSHLRARPPLTAGAYWYAIAPAPRWNFRSLFRIQPRAGGGHQVLPAGRGIGHEALGGPAATDLLSELNDFLHNYGFHGDHDTVTFMQEGLVSARERREQAEAMAD